MKKLFYLFSLLWSITVTAQNYVYPYSDGTKWGLTNSRLEVLAAPQFDGPFRFSPDSFAIVKKEKKSGVINRAGKIILDCKFDEISPKSNVLASGKINNKYVLLNLKAGKQLSATAFDKISEFCYCDKQVFAVTLAGKQGFFSATTGKPVGQIIYDEVAIMGDLNHKGKIKKADKYGLLDFKTGAVLLQPKYDQLSYKYTGSRTLLEAYIGGKKELFDEDGKAIPQTDNKKGDEMDMEAVEEVAIASVEGIKDEEDLLNTSMHLYNLGNGKWKVAFEKRGYGSTEVIKSFELNGYDDLKELVYNPITQDNIPVVKIKATRNGKVGIIDNADKILLPFDYDNLNYKDGYYITEADGKTGVFNRELKEVKKPVCKSIYDVDYTLNAFFVVMPGGQAGYMDIKTGKIFIPGITE